MASVIDKVMSSERRAAGIMPNMSAGHDAGVQVGPNFNVPPKPVVAPKRMGAPVMGSLPPSKDAGHSNFIEVAPMMGRNVPLDPPPKPTVQQQAQPAPFEPTGIGRFAIHNPNYGPKKVATPVAVTAPSPAPVAAPVDLAKKSIADHQAHANRLRDDPQYALTQERARNVQEEQIKQRLEKFTPTSGSLLNRGNAGLRTLATNPEALGEFNALQKVRNNGITGSVDANGRMMFSGDRTGMEASAGEKRRIADNVAAGNTRDSNGNFVTAATQKYIDDKAAAKAEEARQEIVDRANSRIDDSSASSLVQSVSDRKTARTELKAHDDRVEKAGELAANASLQAKRDAHNQFIEKATLRGEERQAGIDAASSREAARKLDQEKLIQRFTRVETDKNGKKYTFVDHDAINEAMAQEQSGKNDPVGNAADAQLVQRHTGIGEDAFTYDAEGNPTAPITSGYNSLFERLGDDRVGFGDKLFGGSQATLRQAGKVRVVEGTDENKNSRENRLTRKIWQEGERDRYNKQNPK